MKDEITKLAVLLAKEDLPFELVAFNVLEKATVQVVSPNKEEHKVDAVCHECSYGGEEGLLEVMWDAGALTVKGWLTAEEALEYFKKELGR